MKISCMSIIIKQPFYKVEIAYFNEYKNLKKLISNYHNCKENNDCSDNKLKMKYGFLFLRIDYEKYYNFNF